MVGGAKWGWIEEPMDGRMNGRIGQAGLDGYRDGGIMYKWMETWMEEFSWEGDGVCIGWTGCRPIVVIVKC